MASYKTLLALLLVFLAACSGRAPFPPAPNEPATAARQQQAFVDAMRPRVPGRPLVAVLAHNASTETTDFLLSHAVLQRSGVAEVQAVAPRRGPVTLYPTLKVEVAQDLAGFDRQHPHGADYVVVPALDDVDDPAIATWLREQSAKGARVIGVCAGALILGRAGLLDGRAFTTHWYFRKDVIERHPDAKHVPHQRYVEDRGVASTTGITASVPTMLALVEAIGGAAKARSLADELGVDGWSPAHDGNAFGMTPARAARYLFAKVAFWRDEAWQVEAVEGMDDIALALAADAWSRTGNVEVAAVGAKPVRLRSGITLLTSPADAAKPALPLKAGLKPMQQLDRTLCEIEARFGDARREWVSMELEYPGRPAC